MAYSLGKALGEEETYEDVDIVLGPAINIKRRPYVNKATKVIMDLQKTLKKFMRRKVVNILKRW